MEPKGPLAKLLGVQADGQELLGAYARVRQRLLAPDVTRVEGEEPVRPAEPPVRIGRYVVVETLGVGGMGMVLRAYDPKLGREVALKRVLDAELASARDRLLREAQAMAKLSHPNVVAVYDVEARDDELVIAMELVPGGDLRDWLLSPRAVPEILARFIAAGRGLAAAHRVGLVHRDFKAANVLLGEDGQVKVGDFGLATTAGVALPSGSPGDDESPVKTAAGVVMGTPLYMAPEQAGGREADARSDQFAFCVALWEALCGAPPFPGKDPVKIQAAKREGPPRWVGPRGVPRRCVDALRRGLEPQAERRFPNMDALLGALSPRPMGRWIAGGVVVAALSGAAFAGSQREDVCSEDRRAVEREWYDTRRPAVLRHLAGLDVPYTVALQEAAERDLDGFLDRWVALHEEVCDPEAQARDEESLELACLELGKAKWDATVTGLASLDAAHAAEGMSLLERLPDLDGCMDVDHIAAEGLSPTSSPQARRAQREILARLEEAKVLGKLGNVDRIEALLGEAEAIAGDDPQHQLLVREGRLTLALYRADYDTAIDMAERLRTDALKAGAWSVAARVGNRLGTMLVWLRGQDARGLEIARSAVAEAEGARLGPEELATAHANLGIALQRTDQEEAGVAELRVALGVREEAGLAHTTNHAHTLIMLGGALADLGAFDEATEVLLEGHALIEDVLGPDHPRTLTFQADSAVTLSMLGMPERAEAILRKALVNAEKTHGPDSRVAFVARDNLAAVLSGNGRPEEAVALLEPGLARKLEVYGPNHEQTWFTQVALAGARLRSGDAQAAIEALEPIVASKDSETLMADLLLGRALSDVGRLDEAKTRLDQGLALAEATAAPRSELRMGLGTERARVALELGDRDDALARLEPLWALVNEAPTPPPKIRIDVAEAYLGALTDPAQAAFVRSAGAAACRELKRPEFVPSCTTLLDTLVVGDRAK